MNDLFISEKNISLQKKSTTQVNAQCTLEIQLVQRLNLMTLNFSPTFFLIARYIHKFNEKRPLPIKVLHWYTSTHQMKEAKLNINSNDLEDILAYTLANIKEKIPGNLLFQDTKVQLTIISERTSQILKLYLKNFKKLVIQEAELLSNDILLHIKIWFQHQERL